MAEDCLVTTSLRSDRILLDSRENTKFSAYENIPCQFYMLRLHQERLLLAAEAFKHPCDHLRGERGLRHLDSILHTYLATRHGHPEFGDPLKIHLTIDIFGKLDVTQSISVPPLELSTLFPPSLDHVAASDESAFHRAFVSPVVTQPSLYTLHKTSRRSVYDSQRAMLPRSTDPLGVPQYTFNDEQVAQWIVDGVQSVDLFETKVLVRINALQSDQNTSPRKGQMDEILLTSQCMEHGTMLMEGSITTPYLLCEDGWCTPSKFCGGNLGSTRKWALEAGVCREGFMRIDDIPGLIGSKILLSNGVRGFGWALLESSTHLKARSD